MSSWRTGSSSRVPAASQGVRSTAAIDTPSCTEATPRRRSSVRNRGMTSPSMLRTASATSRSSALGGTSRMKSSPPAWASTASCTPAVTPVRQRANARMASSPRAKPPWWLSARKPSTSMTTKATAVSSASRRPISASAQLTPGRPESGWSSSVWWVRTWVSDRRTERTAITPSTLPAGVTTTISSASSPMGRAASTAAASTTSRPSRTVSGSWSAMSATG